MIDILLVGKGKMGLEIAKLSKNIKDCISNKDELKQLSATYQGIIDFSHPDNTNEILKYALKHNLPLVIGTTNLSYEQEKLIDQASKRIPICYESNFSLEYQKIKKALINLVSLKTKKIIIIDIHHISKIDSPSGTAKDLKKYLKKLFPSIEIEIISHRKGNVVGIHKIVILEDNDTMELSFKIHKREEFALNALKALNILSFKEKGLYSYDNLVNENEKNK